MNFPLEQVVQLAGRGDKRSLRLFIPISFGLDALRQLLFPGKIEGVLPAWSEMLILFGMGVVFVFWRGI